MTKGTIFIKGTVGRALRKNRAAVLVKDVVDSVGDFEPGDEVNLVMRGNDGGQNAIAIGVVACNALALERARAQPGAAGSMSEPLDESTVVISEPDLDLFWQPKELGR